MIAFTNTLALLLTVGLSLVVGIGSGYLLILAVLFGFNPHRERRQVEATPAPALAAVRTSGD